MLLDVHAHEPNGGTSFEDYVAALERFDSRVVLAHLSAQSGGWTATPTPEHIREANDLAAALVQRRPDRIAGYCYVNPAYTREALDEMERCLVRRPDVFVALKLWVAVRCSDPRLDPLMELCAAHDVPVLQHTYMKVGPGGPSGGNMPGESTPDDLLALARRHPRVKFFGGHTGADWEWGVAAFKQVDNIWMDIGGGEALAGYMDVALRGVGAGRVVFSTDMRGRSIPSQLAKVLCVDLPPDDLEKVLWRNAAGVLGRRTPAAWQPALERPSAPPEVPLPGEGGFFDANSALGEWPSRRVNSLTLQDRPALVRQRLALMDKRGIRRAAVSLLEGVFLKDSSVANQDLHDLVAGQDRLLPVYTLDPLFPAWREHLEQCVRDFGLARGTGALRIVHSYHGYSLDHPALDALLAAVAPLDVPVLLPVQMEDARLHQPAMPVPDLAPAAVAALVNRWPQVRWIVTTAIYAQVNAIAAQLGPAARCWFDIARVQGPVDDVRRLVSEVGLQRLVFGTNLPLHVAESAILELADAHLPPEQDATIRYQNAERAFGLR